MDKAFSMGSMFGKFQYLMSWFKVALVSKRISMVMKKNVSVCEILHFFLEIILPTQFIEREILYFVCLRSSFMLFTSEWSYVDLIHSVDLIGAIFSGFVLTCLGSSELFFIERFKWDFALLIRWTRHSQWALCLANSSISCHDSKWHWFLNG